MRRQYVLACAVSVVPSNSLRVGLYRLLFGYDIDAEARIGPGTVIDVSHARIGKARIRGFCMFRGPLALTIDDGTVMGSWNEVECGEWTTEDQFKDAGYVNECHIGSGCLITGGHYIDATGGFRLGNRSWLAGRGSQFWSHGAGVEDRSVEIGEDCYIASRVTFSPGSSIAKDSLVALGAVVVGRFDDAHVVLAGVPAQVVRSGWDWRAHGPTTEATQ